jgi:hypothetical protein
MLNIPERICLSNISIAKKKTLATLRIKLGLKNLRNMSISNGAQVVCDVEKFWNVRVKQPKEAFMMEVNSKVLVHTKN